MTHQPCTGRRNLHPRATCLVWERSACDSPGAACIETHPLHIRVYSGEARERDERAAGHEAEPSVAGDASCMMDPVRCASVEMPAHVHTLMCPCHAHDPADISCRLPPLTHVEAHATLEVFVQHAAAAAGAVVAISSRLGRLSLGVWVRRQAGSTDAACAGPA
eukprot:360622-Chlamydomonas_euryale.AAC.5